MECRCTRVQEKHYPFKSQLKKNLKLTRFLDRNRNFWRAKHLFIITGKPIASEKFGSLSLLIF